MNAVHVGGSVKQMCPLRKNFDKESCLVMTGDSFDMIMKEALNLRDLNIMNDWVAFAKLINDSPPAPLVKADLYFFAYSSRIFGRCSSDQKTRIINFLKAFRIDPKRTIAFVGDGTNDLQAIKSADVALKLGHSDMSGAISFVSENSQLGALIVLINESKCSLANGYHNFSFMIFFILMQFTGLINLYITGIFYNAVQLIFMDFALLNLFGFYLPAIRPKKSLGVHSPKHSLWHRELIVFLTGEVIAGVLLMTYGYLNLKKGDFYVRPEAIISDEDKHHGHVQIDIYKFFDNHFLFLMTSLFSLIYIAVDNRADKFRRGFFASGHRAFIFALIALLCSFILLIPILTVQGNPFYTALVYIFRVRLIFTKEHPLVCFASLFGVVIAFAVFSVVMKFISTMVGTGEVRKEKVFQNMRTKLINVITPQHE